ncbi:MAG TPA: amidohydrolase family protein [Acidimicrobiales bacterium]|nr:amidohydrolase family protein [Acidimicrobiales bacterium]
MLDLVITGGTVVDGTGRPGRQADVGISDGRIASIGNEPAPARRVVDASGLVVCPGFIDVHTHYDAQVMWDPTISPSALHGVTTVIAGNCGITLAPMGGQDASFLTGLLSRVEAIPLDALEQGLDVRWRSFGEYLNAVASQSPAINIGFLAGHSTIRRHVMGGEASERTASPAETEQLSQQLAEALSAGAMGFSSATAATHRDGAGLPTPPAFAANQELIALAAVCRDFPGTSVEFIPESSAYGFTEDEYQLLTAMSLAAQRPVNWNTVLLNYPAIPDIHERQLASADKAEAVGGFVVPMIIPHNFRVRTDFLESDVGFRSVPGFEELFDLPPAERLRAIADPSVRARLHHSLEKAPVGTPAMFRDSLADHVVSDSDSDKVQALVGQSVAKLASDSGATPLDVMLDLAAASDLDVGFVRHLVPVATAEERALRAKVLRDPRVVLGASDGGAHVRGVVNVEYSTASFAELVRDEPVFTLEELVQEFTDIPAQLYGLVDRGQLREGAHADIVIFDPGRIGASAVRIIRDLPGGAARLFSRGLGIESVLVAGTEIVCDGGYTGAQPGRVLRAGTESQSPARLHLWPRRQRAAERKEARHGAS